MHRHLAAGYTAAIQMLDIRVSSRVQQQMSKSTGVLWRNQR